MPEHFHVTLQPSGHAFETPSGQTVLSAALKAGLNIPYSCRSGTCVTCKARVVKGQVQYKLANAGLSIEAGTALLCQAEPVSDLVLEVEELQLHLQPPRTMPCRVRKIERAAPDVAVVGLRTHYNDTLLYAAGQYIDFLLSEGKRRSYSIATAPSPDGSMIDIELHIRHLPGGLFTDRLFNDGVKVGQIIDFEGPLGTFYLREDSTRPIVFLASGTGFAPIKAIIEHAFNRKVTRPMRLYWGGRVRADLYLDALARRWADEHANFTYVPVLSEARAEDQWRGRTGFVHRAVLEDFADLSAHEVYASGNPAMVEAARHDFATRGLQREHFHADSFITEAERAGA